MPEWKNEIIPIDTLPPDDPVRRQRDEARQGFEERASYMRQQATEEGDRSDPGADPARQRAIEQAERYSVRPNSVRPTDIKLPAPSGSIRTYCTRCGNSVQLSLPASEPKPAARFIAHGMTVEVFEGGESARILMALVQLMTDSGKR